MKMIVESMMECRLAGETEVLGENLPQRHHRPSYSLDPTVRTSDLFPIRINFELCIL
jgi:hypothetical protein